MSLQHKSTLSVIYLESSADEDINISINYGCPARKHCDSENWIFIIILCDVQHEATYFSEGEEPSSPSTESTRTSTITSIEPEVHFNQESRSDAWNAIVHTTKSLIADDTARSGDGTDLGK